MQLEENWFGDRLKFCRDKVGSTQAELAEAVDVSPQTVRDWERGRKFPHMRKLPAIAAALGIEVGSLFPSTSLPGIWPATARDQVVTRVRLGQMVDSIEQDLARLHVGVGRLQSALKAEKELG